MECLKKKRKPIANYKNGTDYFYNEVDVKEAVLEKFIKDE